MRPSAVVMTNPQFSRCAVDGTQTGGFKGGWFGRGTGYLWTPGNTGNCSARNSLGRSRVVLAEKTELKNSAVVSSLGDVTSRKFISLQVSSFSHWAMPGVRHASRRRLEPNSRRTGRCNHVGRSHAAARNRYAEMRMTLAGIYQVCRRAVTSRSKSCATET